MHEAVASTKENIHFGNTNVCSYYYTVTRMWKLEVDSEVLVGVVVSCCGRNG